MNRSGSPAVRKTAVMGNLTAAKQIILYYAKTPCLRGTVFLHRRNGRARGYSSTGTKSISLRKATTRSISASVSASWSAPGKR